MKTPDEPPVTPNELAERVTYSMLATAARLAGAFDLPLKGVGRQLQTAYFQVLRDRGLKLREISERLEISPSLAATFSKRLKERFFAPEGAPALSRRIEFMLWAEPMSEARLLQVLPGEEPDDVAAAVAELLAEGRVVRDDDRIGRLRTARGASRLVRDELRGRIDGLNHLLGGVAQAVYARFFAPGEPAFARVLTLRVRPEDLPELERLYRERIWPTLEALDAAAQGHDDARAMEVVVTWAPYRLIERKE